MEKSIYKTKIKVTIGVLIVFIGLCLLFSTHFKKTKFLVFDEMNDLYYRELISFETDLEEVDEEPILIGDVISEEVTESASITTQPTTTVQTVDYSNYYVGSLSIPKINLKKGFTKIDNRYNNVNRNLEVIKPSDYPDKVNGNFIIAGHSGTSSVAFFKDLYKLNLEDEVFITYNEIEYKYIIKDIYTDTKDGTIEIKRNKNKTTLTLITCTKNDRTTQTIYIAERD